jgi:hypothetical protein
MFQADISDYVRRSYDTLEDACQAHADAAVRLARYSVGFRLATLACTAIAAALAWVAAAGHPGWSLAAAVAAACAFAASAAYVGFNQQPRIHGHRACSARLWLVCEKYRELLVEMEAGRLDATVLRERRYGLLQEAATVFEHVAPADRYTFEIARRALGARSGAPVIPSAPAAA